MIIVLGSILAVIFAAVVYLGTSNLYLSVGIMAIAIIYFIVFAHPKIKMFNNKIVRFNECYNFINNFVVSLSIKGSINGALETCKNVISDDFSDVLDSIKDQPDNEKLTYLKKYFHFHVYQLFVDVIAVWQEQGGDIIAMSHYLVNELRQMEEYLTLINQIHKKRIFEFSTLWVLTIVILIILKFSLSQFFSMITTLPFFQGSIFALFVFILVSIEITISKVTKVELGGWINEK